MLRIWNSLPKEVVSADHLSLFFRHLNPVNIVMSRMRVCRKQALSRVKYYYYVINSKIQQATIMTVIMTK